MGRRISIVAGSFVDAAMTVGLVLLPMIFAFAGGYVDEVARQGFTTWQAACRVAGLSFASLADFTWQLLPSAIVGALAGGLLVLLLGVARRRTAGVAQSALAAHVGCALAMAPGLLLCAAGIAWPVAFALELAAAVLVAAGVRAFVARVQGNCVTAHP